MRSREQVKFSLLIADAYHVSSLLAQAEGRSTASLYFARLNVKSNQRSWAALEKSRGKFDTADAKSKDMSTDDILAGPLSEMSIDGDRTMGRSESRPFARNLAAFWILIPRLFHGFVQLSRISAFHGLFSEVKYYLDQARKIAESVKAPSFMGQYSSLMGQYLGLGGDLRGGIGSLQTADKALSTIPHDRSYVQLQLSLAKYHTEHGDWPTAQAAFAMAEQTLGNLLTPKFLRELTHQPPLEGLEVQLSALSIQETKPMRRSPSQKVQVNSKKKVTAKQKVDPMPANTLPKAMAVVDAISLNQVKSEILRSRTFATLHHESLASAAALLEGEAPLSSDQCDFVQQALLKSKIQLRQGVKRLLSNPVYCVLQESTISCPSIRAIDNRQRQKQQLSPIKNQENTRTNPGRHTKGKGPAVKTGRRSPASGGSEISLLDLAQTGLNEVHRLAKTHSSTSTLHDMAAVLGKILMMLSATPLGPSSPPTSPAFIAYILGSSILCPRVSPRLTPSCRGR